MVIKDSLAPKTGAGYNDAMRVIARSTLLRFIDSLTALKDQGAVKIALAAWFHEVRKARWTNSSHIRRQYATASIVSSDRVVFNIKGNAYRLVVAVDFELSIIWIQWIGTHDAYDRINVTEVEHE